MAIDQVVAIGQEMCSKAPSVRLDGRISIGTERNSSARMPDMLTNDNIMAALGRVKDPEIGRDLVSLGMVKEIAIDGRSVDLTVELTTPACPLKATIENEIVGELEALGAT